MFREETSKPQYQVRPSLYIHAATHAEAVQRLGQVQAYLRDAMYQFNANADNYKLNFLYEDVEWDPGHLVALNWPDGEAEVVR